MNNKYIDNKLKQFREKFKHSQFVDYSAIEQFIKEALESAYEQGYKQCQEVYGIDEGFDKLKSEQEECHCHCHRPHKIFKQDKGNCHVKSCTHCQKPEEKV